MWRAARKKNPEKTHHVVGGTCGEHFVQVPEGSRRSDAIRWKEAYTIICASRRESAGETDILRTVEQNASQKQFRSVAGSGNSAECFVETADGVYSERGEVRNIEQQDR